jgi:two-component system chemotaxis sensor kinase CheA
LGIINRLEDEYEFELVDEFVEHLGFMCSGLELLILGLEKPEQYANDVQELFRIFHNIKSASSFFKLNAMSKLSQLVEDVLEEARASKGYATQEFIDWMLIVSDQFNKWKSNLELNEESLSSYNPRLIKIPKKLVIPVEIDIETP